MLYYCCVIFCVLSLCWLSVPVQIIDWKDSSPKWPVLIGTSGPKPYSSTPDRVYRQSNECYQTTMERIYAALNDDDKLAVDVIKNCQWKKHSKETQTLHAGCSVIFAPPQTPSRGRRSQDGQNLISWRWSLPLPTNPVWWRSMHAISSYRGNRPTNRQRNPHTHTNKPTARTDYNTPHC